MPDTNINLDLDALSPKSAVINYKGTAIEVKPLELDTYATMLDLSAEMSGLDTTNQDPKAIMPIYEKMKAVIGQIVPELAEAKLNLQQILAVFNLLIQANSPEDKTIKELADKGIELKKEGDSDPKGSTSSEPSASSAEPTPPTE